MGQFYQELLEMLDIELAAQQLDRAGWPAAKMNIA